VHVFFKLATDGFQIGDFGLACSESTIDSSVPSAADDDEPGGTLPYAAPELLLGLRAYASPIDVWSAGCFAVRIID
jgi:serine/threonine protein kinase